MNARSLGETILHRHLFKFRVSTARQIADAFFAECKNPLRQSNRVLKRLLDDELLGFHSATVRDTPAIRQALFDWSPGRKAPDFNVLSYRSEKRFSFPTKSQKVFFATKKAERRFGGHGGPTKRVHQLAHDLVVTKVYLHLEKLQPETANDWVGEDLYVKHLNRAEKIGDALLFNHDGPYRLIEVLGRYSSEHIRDLHRFAEDNDIPYEIW